MKYWGFRITKVYIFFFLLFLSVSVQAATYYISPSGQIGALGTSGDPFGNIETALRQHGGGHTYIFKPGVYTGQITIRPEHKGTPQNPTVLKSEEKYKAILHGSIGHNIYVYKGTDWVIIDGFVSSGAGFTGIKSNANYTVIRNCWVHNNSLQGIEAHNVVGSIIEYNLIEFNGKNIQYDHGVYASGENLIIRGNIVRYNSGHGLHLYESVSHSRIESNLIYGNNRSGILAWSPGTGGYNYILNNTIVDNEYAFSFVNASGNIIANNLIVNNNKSHEHIVNDFDFHVDPNKLTDTIITSNLVSPEYLPLKNKNISIKPEFYDYNKKIFFVKNFDVIPLADKKYLAQTNFMGAKNDANTAPYFGCFPYLKQSQVNDMASAYYYGWPFASYNDPNNSKLIPPDLWNYTDK